MRWVTIILFAELRTQANPCSSLTDTLALAYILDKRTPVQGIPSALMVKISRLPPALLIYDPRRVEAIPDLIRAAKFAIL